MDGQTDKEKFNSLCCATIKYPLRFKIPYEYFNMKRKGGNYSSKF